MGWRQTTLLGWLTHLNAFLAGTSAENPIEIIDDSEEMGHDHERNDDQPDGEEQLGTGAYNPIIISDSEHEDAPSAFEVTEHRQLARTPVPENWPRVPYWTYNRGRKSVRFMDINLGLDASAPCLNTQSAIFCDDRNCNAGPLCGNRMLDCDSLEIMRCVKGLGIRTTADIPHGAVVGEYCGKIIPREKLTVDHIGRGFVLKFKSRDSNGARVYIDAAPGGSMCRFVNHSCRPNCRIEERANRTTRKMVFVTERRVYAGEEITVRYKKKIRSFHCLCGEPNC